MYIHASPCGFCINMFNILIAMQYCYVTKAEKVAYIYSKPLDSFVSSLLFFTSGTNARWV